MDQEHLHVRFFQEFLTPPNPESAAKWLSQHLSPRIKSSAPDKAVATLVTVHHSRLQYL